SHTSLGVGRVCLSEFGTSVQVFPAVLKGSDHVRAGTFPCKNLPGVPGPCVILVLVPRHVILSAGLVLLGRTRLDSVNVNLCQIARLLGQRRNQQHERRQDPECCTCSTHTLSPFSRRSVEPRSTRNGPKSKYFKCLCQSRRLATVRALEKHFFPE